MQTGDPAVDSSLKGARDENKTHTVVGRTALTEKIFTSRQHGTPLLAVRTCNLAGTERT